jgi:uncharacterized protein with HEPN domain
VSRDVRLYLIDMRDACARLMRHCGGLWRDQFFANRLIRDAALWNLLVLGEAA